MDRNGEHRPPPSHRRRRGFVVAATLFVGMLAADLSRAPSKQWTARAMLLGIDTYQAWLSPRLTKRGVHCRFEPTCSRYAEASIREHGALGGAWRTTKRLARCGPWTPRGTFDPP